MLRHFTVQAPIIGYERRLGVALVDHVCIQHFISRAQVKRLHKVARLMSVNDLFPRLKAFSKTLLPLWTPGDARIQI